MTGESEATLDKSPTAEIHVLYLALGDRRTPITAKLLIALLVAYVISPLDPIPDVIPLIGFADELLMMYLVSLLTRRIIPDPVMAEYREQPLQELDGGKLRWFMAGIIVLFWAVIGLLIGQMLIRIL